MEAVWSHVSTPLLWTLLPSYRPRAEETLACLERALVRQGGVVVIDFGGANVSVSSSSSTWLARVRRAVERPGAALVVASRLIPEPWLGDDSVTVVRVSDGTRDALALALPTVLANAGVEVPASCRGEVADVVWQLLGSRWGDIMRFAQHCSSQRRELLDTCRVATEVDRGVAVNANDPAQQLDEADTIVRAEQWLSIARSCAVKACQQQRDRVAVLIAAAAGEVSAPSGSGLGRGSGGALGLPTSMVYEALMFGLGLHGRPEMASLGSNDEETTLVQLVTHLAALWGTHPEFSVWVRRLLQDEWLELHPLTDAPSARAARIAVRPSLVSCFTTDVLEQEARRQRFERGVTAAHLRVEASRLTDDTASLRAELQVLDCQDAAFRVIAGGLPPNVALERAIDLRLQCAYTTCFCVGWRG